MGKQNAVMKSWVEFVKKTRRDMSKKGKKVSYKDAMKEASRRKKQWKRGGAATSYTIPAAATSTGGAATSHTIPAAATSHFTNSAATIPAAATSTGGKKTRRHRRKGGAATGVAANAATIGGRRHIRKTRKHRRHSRKH
jgi:hypothetical protein